MDHSVYKNMFLALLGVVALCATSALGGRGASAEQGYLDDKSLADLLGDIGQVSDSQLTDVLAKVNQVSWTGRLL